MHVGNILEIQNHQFISFQLMVPVTLKHCLSFKLSESECKCKLWWALENEVKVMVSGKLFPNFEWIEKCFSFTLNKYGNLCVSFRTTSHQTNEWMNILFDWVDSKICEISFIPSQRRCNCHDIAIAYFPTWSKLKLLQNDDGMSAFKFNV